MEAYARNRRLLVSAIQQPFPVDSPVRYMGASLHGPVGWRMLSPDVPSGRWRIGKGTRTSEYVEEG